MKHTGCMFQYQTVQETKSINKNGKDEEESDRIQERSTSML